MLNGQPETLEEALALLKEQQQELQAKDEQLKTKDSLLKKQSEDLQQADIDLKNTTKQLKQANKDLDAKDKKIERIEERHKKSVNKLKSEKADLKEELRALKVQFDILKDQLALKNFNDFNAKTEKVKKQNKDKSYRQDAGDTKNGDGPKEPKKKKGRPNTQKKYTSLPVRRFEDVLDESERICEVCGTVMSKAREHVQRRIVHVPGYEYIEEYVYYTYECTNCCDDENNTTTKSSYEGSMVECGIATPSLLAHAFVGKYLQHTPFYCQAQFYGWQNIEMCRQNFSNWQIKVYERLKPLEDLLFKKLKMSKYLMFDETPYKVQEVNETEREAEKWENQVDNDAEADYSDDFEEDKIENSIKQCYIWVMLGEYNGHQIIKYNFRWTRCGTFVKEMLNGFSGNVIQADGFSGYDSAVRRWNEENPEHLICRSSCNVHARRGFFNVIKSSKSEFCQKVVDLYGNIFNIEDVLRKEYEEGKLSEAEFVEKRKKQSEEIFDQLSKMLKVEGLKQKYLSSGATAKAINYFNNHEEQLKEYLKYSYLTPSTNAAERAIRPLTLTRKVSMFFGSGVAADSSCFLSSLIEMCKNEEISPEEYLRCLFEQFPKIDPTDEAALESLLPWNIKLSPFDLRGEWVKDKDYEILKQKLKVE